MRTPYTARASSRPYSANGQIAFDTSFLNDGFAGGMVAPEMQNLRLRATGKITVPAMDAVSQAVLKRNIFSRFFAYDARGDCINAAGASLIQYAQREAGGAYVEGPDIANAGGMAADIAFDIELVIPFERRRAQDPADTRQPVTDFSGTGGQLRVQTGLNGAIPTTGASTATIVSGSTTLELYSDILDAGTKRATSRLQLRDYAVTGQDFRYPTEGLLCELWLSASPDDIDAGTTLAARNYISDGLGYAAYASTVLNDKYRTNLYSVSSSDDVESGEAQSIFSSYQYQSSAELPDLQLVQVRFDVTPETGSQVVVASITQRAPAQMADALGVPPSALPALANNAVTIGKSGSVPYGGKLSLFLPAKVTGNKAA